MSIITNKHRVRIEIVAKRSNGWVLVQTQGWAKSMRIVHQSEISKR